MLHPIYVDFNLRILPVATVESLIGDDWLRWPKSFWVRRDKEDVPYFLVNPEMYAFIIVQVQRWKKNPNVNRVDLNKSIARYQQIQKLVHESFSEGELSTARTLARWKPPTPKAAQRIPDFPLDEEIQSRVFFLFKDGKRDIDKKPHKPRNHTAETLAGSVPMVTCNRLPPAVWYQLKKFLIAERITEYQAIMAFDSYFNQGLGRDLRSSVEFIDEMIRQKHFIPSKVMAEHKVRKKYLEMYVRGVVPKEMEASHQHVMNGFRFSRKPLFQGDLYDVSSDAERA